jgi:hypothetical protein
VVDTSVLVAGNCWFQARRDRASKRQRNNASGLGRKRHIHLITDEIILEYKDVLRRLGVRRSTVGRVINLLTEEGELIPIASEARISPDPGDDPFCLCSEHGGADFLVTLNLRDFPQRLLAVHVIAPGEKIPTTGRRKHFRNRQR